MGALNKTYLYKIFAKDGTYLGLLQKVGSDFSYNQTVGTAGAQLQIVVNQSVDVANQPSSPILDEVGQPILDETGAQILDEGTGDIVGSSNSNNLIQNNNLVKVYEVSSYNPTGKIVYSGYISKWKVVNGAANNIVITCLNLGQDFAQMVIPGGNALTIDQQQTSQNDFVTGNAGSANEYFGNVWTVGGGITNLAALTLKLYSSIGETAHIAIWNNPTDASNGVTPIATSTINVAAGGSPTDYQFTIPGPLAVTAGQQYYFGFSLASTTLNMYIYDSKVYGGGDSYLLTTTGTLFHDTTQDSYFKTYYSHKNTERLYTNRDVAYILNDIMAQYTGSVAYSAISNTGVTIPTYTFKANTYLEGIQAIAQMGPSNYYWYIDVATNTLHYKAASTTGDILLIQGRHFNELDIEATKENIINIVYYTGGDDGTATNTNAFVQVTSATSLVTDRIGTARLTNTNVTGTTAYQTLQILAQNYINLHSSETYIANATIADGTFDLSSLNVGLVAGFAGFGNFTDNLLLQIVGISLSSDQATIQMGTLPIRASQVVEQITTQLTSTQTVANPDIPS